MTISTSNVPLGTNFNAGQAPSAAETKQIVIKEIRAKWGKFSEDDLSSLKEQGDDLVTASAPRSTVWRNRWRKAATSTPPHE